MREMSQNRTQSMKRRTAARTPQARTGKNLTERGYLVGTVEGKKRFPDKQRSTCHACGHVPMIEISSDLWNVFDVIAVHPGKLVFDIVFVQTTSRDHCSHRRNKILASMEAKLVLLSGARILLQSWDKDEKINRWVVRDEWITLEMFKQAVSYPNTVAELMGLKGKEKKSEFPTGWILPFMADVV